MHYAETDETMVGANFRYTVIVVWLALTLI